MQNSEENSQEQKFSTLQAQNHIGPEVDHAVT